MPRAASTSNKRFPSCIGIDDGPFPLKSPSRTAKAPLVAACLRGVHLAKLSITWITVDGLDATEKARAALETLPRSPILLSGVTFGGFNLIDPRKIQQRFKVPTMIVVGSKPDNRAVKRALVKHFQDWKERWEIIRSLGPLRSARTVADEPPIFYEALGCTASEARKILMGGARVSRVPEPLRVAGLVARGLFKPRTLSPTG